MNRRYNLIRLSAALASHAATIYALGESGGNLFNFDSAAPGTAVNNQSLSGVPGGQSQRAIDFRPSNGRLYMLSTGSTTSDAWLYMLNLNTGAAALVGSITLTGALGIRHSMDWSPVTDRLHIIPRGSRRHYEVDPVILSVPTLSPFAAGTAISRLAFDNNVTGSPSSTACDYHYNVDELRRVTNLVASTTVSVGTPFGAFSTNAASQGLGINGADGAACLNADLFDGPLAGTGEHRFTLNLTTAAATDANGALISRVFTLPGDALKFAGEWKQEKPLAEVKRDDLAERAGCEIILTTKDAATFEGNTTDKKCQCALPSMLSTVN